LAVLVAEKVVEYYLDCILTESRTLLKRLFTRPVPAGTFRPPCRPCRHLDEREVAELRERLQPLLAKYGPKPLLCRS